MTTPVPVLADPELFEPMLDLHRPELEDILARYVCDELEGATPTALIVEGDGSSEPQVARELTARGWEISRCGGPVGTDCPLLSGAECPLRKLADVAVVYADPREMSEGTSMTPRLRCAAGHDTPGMLVLMGRLDPPRIRGRHAVVGAKRDASVIAGTIEELRTRV